LFSFSAIVIKNPMEDVSNAWSTTAFYRLKKAVKYDSLRGVKPSCTWKIWMRTKKKNAEIREILVLREARRHVAVAIGPRPIELGETKYDGSRASG